MSVPEPALMRVDRTVDPEQAVAGCRSFDAAGCSACCVRSANLSGATDCLELDAKGERSLGGPCPESCESCAECTLAMEQDLRGFPQQTECSCTTPRATLGCEPSDPCECYCMDIEIAAYRCSHLVCED